jgi:putative membrane protein
MMLTLTHIGGRAAGGGLFFLGPLFFLLLAGLVLFMVFRRTRRQMPWMVQPSSGLTVLEERYANGEIDREEYLAKREDLAPQSKKPDKKK